MVGTRLDRSDDGTNVFVRRYGPTGVLAGTLTIDQAAEWVLGNSVATLGNVAFAVGTRYDKPTGVMRSGEAWRVHV
jgi:hypothetical protein